MAGGSAAAHYVGEYLEVDGLKFPTRRVVYPRRADNTPDRETYAASGGAVIRVAIDDIMVKT